MYDLDELFNNLAKKKLYIELRNVLRDDNDTVLYYVKIYTLHEFCKLCYGLHFDIRYTHKPIPHKGTCIYELERKTIESDVFYCFSDAINFVKNYEHKNIKDKFNRWKSKQSTNTDGSKV